LITEAFRHTRPVTLPDALALLNATSTPYAGGTEIIAAMKLGLVAPEHLVDLKRVQALREISVTGDELVIGSGCTHDQVAHSDVVVSTFPMIAALAGRIGNTRVRTQGTVGGNLCFADPRSDLATGLVAAQAAVDLVSASGQRRVAVQDFIVGPLATTIEPDELLTAVRVDLRELRFQEYQRVAPKERPIVGVGVVGRRSGWRIAVGAATYRPIWLDADAAEGLSVERLLADVDLMSDSDGSAKYRRHLVEVLTTRILQTALAARQ
jgi:carbon-monoxide dehydrogenase medium subunit